MSDLNPSQLCSVLKWNFMIWLYPIPNLLVGIEMINIHKKATQDTLPFWRIAYTSAR